MDIKTIELEVHTTFAWWWHWLYVPSLYAGLLVGRQPNWDRVAKVALRASRITIREKRPGEFKA